MRSPFQWLRDRRDPLRDITPIEFDIPGSDPEEEMSTDLRDALEAFASGGLPGYTDYINAIREREREAEERRQRKRAHVIALLSLLVGALSLLVALLALIMQGDG